MTTHNAGTTVRKDLPQEFITLCKANGVDATRRQFSKFRNGYGRLAAILGKSNRTPPPGK